MGLRTYPAIGGPADRLWITKPSNLEAFQFHLQTEGGVEKSLYILETFHFAAHGDCGEWKVWRYYPLTPLDVFTTIMKHYPKPRMHSDYWDEGFLDRSRIQVEPGSMNAQ